MSQPNDVSNQLAALLERALELRVGAHRERSPRRLCRRTSAARGSVGAVGHPADQAST